MGENEQNPFAGAPLADDEQLGLNLPEAQAIQVEEIKVEAPHWRFNRHDILKVLEIVSRFPTTSLVYLYMEYYQPVGATPKVRFVASNKDYYLECYLDVVNVDFIYKQTAQGQGYFIDTNVLSTLVKAYSDFVILFENDKPHYFNSQVKYLLDTFQFDIKDYVIEAPKQEDYEPFLMNKDMFNSARKLVSQSARITDARAVILNSQKEDREVGMMLGFFMLYSFNFELPFKVKEPFYLRKVDFDVIASMYSYDGFGYQTTKKRVWVNFPLGQLSFMKIPYDNKMALSLLSKETTGTSSINMSWLKRALQVLLYFKVQSVRFYRDGDTVYLRYRDSANFKLGIGDITSEFQASSEILKKAVLSIPDITAMLDGRYTSTGMMLSFDDEAGLEYHIQVARMGSEQGNA